MRQGIFKDAFEFTEGWHSTYVLLRLDSYPSDRHFFNENKILICQWISIGQSFLVRDTSFCRLLISVLGSNLVQKLHTMCILPQFLLVHMCFNPVEVEGCLFMAGTTLWVFLLSNPLALVHYLSPLVQYSVSPEGEVLMETSHSVVFQCFSFSAYYLAVSLFSSVQNFQEEYPLLYA